MLRNMATALVLAAALAAASYAYEIRSSRVGSWELAFNSKPPRVLVLSENGSRVEYTYVVYEVKNETSEDVDFYPTFAIESESGATTCAGVYPDAEARIATRFGKDILGAASLPGVIKPGETKRSVAIFKGVDPASDTLTIYVSGLSGDYKMDKTEDGKLVAKYRTYKMIYERPGDQWDVTLDPVTLKGTDWIWRE